MDALLVASSIAVVSPSTRRVSPQGAVAGAFQQVHTRGLAALVDRKPRQYRTSHAIPEKASQNATRHSGTPC